MRPAAAAEPRPREYSFFFRKGSLVKLKHVCKSCERARRLDETVPEGGLLRGNADAAAVSVGSAMVAVSDVSD